MPEAYIVDAVRVAGGRRNGRLSDWHPADLGGAIIESLLDRTGADPATIDDVIFGCVTQAGEQSQNIARTAALSSRLPPHVPGVTLDRQCGSSQQAIAFASQAVMSGTMDIIIAGGVESMTRIPMMTAARLPEREDRSDYRGKRFKSRFEGPVPDQFTGAEMVAEKYGLTKEAMDEFSLKSHQKAAAATERGAFEREICELTVTTRNGEEIHRVDEGIRFDASLPAIAQVRLLKERGRLSAASSSQICDGAAAVLVVNEKGLRTLGVEPMARIHQLTVYGGDPIIMLETPIEATRVSLKRAGLSINDIDLYEINEAFASIPMAWAKALGADEERLNVNGGAIALGHPLGASGARLTATLVHKLKSDNLRYGLQSMCEGGGLANVTIVERL